VVTNLTERSIKNYYQKSLTHNSVNPVLLGEPEVKFPLWPGLCIHALISIEKSLNQEVNI